MIGEPVKRGILMGPREEGLCIKCRVCGQEHDIPISSAQVQEWRSGGLIQNVAPHLTPGQRDVWGGLVYFLTLQSPVFSA